jgi:hypothetical protein
MLRITVVDDPSEEKWILQGQLTGEFCSELISNWRASVERCAERLRVVDLSEITWIDKSGEEVLLKMIREHAKFIVTGLYTSHLVEELQARVLHEKATANQA